MGSGGFCAPISAGASQCRMSPRLQLSTTTLHRISVRITQVCALGESLKSNNQAGPLIAALSQGH
ncbi:mCG140521 [Mus musculus]|nr:mCG140521 [Mus musculus]